MRATILYIICSVFPMRIARTYYLLRTRAELRRCKPKNDRSTVALKPVGRFFFFLLRRVRQRVQHVRQVGISSISRVLFERAGSVRPVHGGLGGSYKCRVRKRIVVIENNRMVNTVHGVVSDRGGGGDKGKACASRYVYQTRIRGSNPGNLKIPV